MSGEDEKAQVESPEKVETSKGESKADSKSDNMHERVPNGEDIASAEKDEKKIKKRKATTSSKAKEESGEDGEQADEDSEVEEKSTKKKKPASSRKSPVKKPKKNDSSEEDETEEPEVKKAPNKRAAPKKSKKEDNTKEEDSNEEDEDEVVKKGVPLLDQPLEVAGSRERKKVSRFEEEFNKEKEVKKAFEIPQGKGIRLGDIPRIEYNISKFSTENIKPVSKALFGSRGPPLPVVKKIIRNFNGYDFDAKSDQCEKRKILITKLRTKQVKLIAEVLDLEKKGTLSDLVERVVDFCLNPKDSGKAPPASRSKRKSASKAVKKGYAESEDSDSKPTGAKRGKGKRSSPKDSKNPDSDENVKQKTTSRSKKTAALDLISEDEREDEENAEDQVNDGSDHDVNNKSEDEEPEKEDKEDIEEKPKRGRKPAPKKPKATKSAPAKKAAPKKKKAVSESEPEGNESDSDDDPLIKRISRPPPSDEDIKTFVKRILEGANLEEITMKTVCKQVYEEYPEHDLAHKKELIKDTVKMLIST